MDSSNSGRSESSFLQRNGFQLEMNDHRRTEQETELVTSSIPIVGSLQRDVDVSDGCGKQISAQQSADDGYGK